MTVVQFMRLDIGRGGPGYPGEPVPPVHLPAYQSTQAAGMDLCSAYEITIPPGDMQRVSTGFRVKIARGYEGQVRSRSGMAFKHRCVVLNQPGTIDSDYTGELFVMLVNLGEEPVTIHRNDRVAQLVVSPVVRATIKEVDEMPDTERGEGGFGSTGGMPSGSPLRRLTTDEEVNTFLAEERSAGRLRPAPRTAELIERLRALPPEELEAALKPWREGWGLGGPAIGEPFPHGNKCFEENNDVPFSVMTDDRIPEGCALLVGEGQKPVLLKATALAPPKEQQEEASRILHAIDANGGLVRDTMG